jgi:hypothetical protein
MNFIRSPITVFFEVYIFDKSKFLVYDRFTKRKVCTDLSTVQAAINRSHLAAEAEEQLGTAVRDTTVYHHKNSSWEQR